MTVKTSSACLPTLLNNGDELKTVKYRNTKFSFHFVFFFNVILDGTCAIGSTYTALLPVVVPVAGCVQNRRLTLVSIKIIIRKVSPNCESLF